jgi:uncharacterized protein YndB with AHSA1/START domain
MSFEKTFDHKGKLIRAEMQTSLTPEQAWEAWADPEKIAHWFVDRASGEAKPGGRWRSRSCGTISKITFVMQNSNC